MVGKYVRTFCATWLVSGTWLLGKAVRQGVPFTTLVVVGSKICPWSTGFPSHGLIKPVGPPSSAEKSPFRSAMVGRVEVTVCPRFCRYCSHAKKKNVLFFPSYTFGIQTGPPNVPP